MMSHLDFLLESLEVIPDLQRGEKFLVARDVRHQQKGYRVLRYTLDGDEQWIWDEQYQFYTSLDDFFVAIENEDYEQARKVF